MTISTGTKLLAGGALVVTGGGMVIAAGIAGFVAGAAVAVWAKNEDEARRPAYKRMGPPRGTPGTVSYDTMKPPGATGPAEETPS